MLNGVLRDKKINIDTKLQIYRSIIRNAITYSTETWQLDKELSLKLLSTGINCFRRPVRYSKLETERYIVSNGKHSRSLNTRRWVRYRHLHVDRRPKTRMPRQVW